MIRALLLAALWLAGTWTSAALAAPRWLDDAGRPLPGARDALALLATAGDDGLDPRDYDAAGLAARAPDAAWAAALEANLLRYLRHLHGGRVTPRDLGFGVVAAPLPAAELARRLDEAVAAGRLVALADELRPAFVQYRQLRAALAAYRTLAAAGAWPVLPAPPAPQALRQRLQALGDLPADAPDTGSDDDATLADAVRHFQARHGLAADGVPGRATQAALNVTPAQRVRQIELALERLRWLPPRSARPVVAVNIPMYRLWAWDAGRDDAHPALSMGVIVGRALNTRTPVFADEMRWLVFRPSWHVPRSIVRDEILPALARDPSYLARHDMELTQVPGEALPRIRQRPGPSNALGLVKFIFPNDANVYLHGTPAPRLFAQPRRDFSHGCVRVEDPVALAQWVLKDRPEWTREAILAAMNGGDSRQVDLSAPLPVLLYYLTAMVMPEDGQLHFAADIYGHDAALERALSRRPRP
ncbi:MAG: L,D-transpeptidase family protein [Piscinibacter sp.]|uniref:L,D-transpeptidase family protein n=1 Tax=Piscinibacter sp. TaxID=1903157 RepID=UPI0025888665|nr:L,D-transpeptidase family protein [Piscinibacter sp.]MCW5664124.1 L,D-transpeptidase family protein [Piscinibacter sp.]